MLEKHRAYMTITTYVKMTEVVCNMFYNKTNVPHTIPVISEVNPFYRAKRGFVLQGKYWRILWHAVHVQQCATKSTSIIVENFWYYQMLFPYLWTFPRLNSSPFWILNEENFAYVKLDSFNMHHASSICANAHNSLLDHYGKLLDFHASYLRFNEIVKEQGGGNKKKQR